METIIISGLNVSVATKSVPDFASVYTAALPCARKANSKVVKHASAVLADVRCTIPAQKCTLVVGSRGSGKTSVLRAIAGVLEPSKGVTIHGSVSSGSGASSVSCCYVPSVDAHDPGLTVHETLSFAAHFANGRQYKHNTTGMKTLTVPSEDDSNTSVSSAGTSSPSITEAELSQVISDGTEPPQPQQLATDRTEKLPESSTGSTSTLEVATILSLLGLASLQNHRVKSLDAHAMRMLSLAEALLTGSPLLAFDEVKTTALADSRDNTCLSYIRGFNVARSAGATVVASVTEPSPSLWAWADHIILLSDGHVLHEGPRGQFERWLNDTLAVTIPSTMSIGRMASILCADPVGTVHRYGLHQAAPESPARRMDAAGIAALRRPSISTDQTQKTPAVLLTAPFATPSLSFGRQLALLSHRRAVQVVRAPQLLLAKMAIGVGAGLLLGTLLVNPSAINLAPRTTVAMLLGINIFVLGGLDMGHHYLTNSVTGRQGATKGGHGWYHPMAQALAALLVGVPVHFLSVLPTLVLLYFMVDLSHDAGRFFFAWLCTAAVSAYTQGWGSFLAVTIANQRAATGAYMGATIFGLTASGMLLAYTRLPPHFRYFAYWLNPFSWFIRSLLDSQLADGIYESKALVAQRVINGVVTDIYSPMTRGAGLANSLDLDVSTEMQWAGPFYCIGVMIVGTLFAGWRVYRTVHQDEPGAKRAAVVSDSSATTLPVRTVRPLVPADLEVSLKPAVPVTLTWTAVSYTQPRQGLRRKPTQLLAGAFGCAYPGRVTGIVSYDTDEAPASAHVHHEAGEEAEGAWDQAGTAASGGLAEDAEEISFSRAQATSFFASGRALLSALVQRPLQGKLAEGAIKYNQQTASPALAAAVVAISYADDAHNGLETVREAIEAAAYLRVRPETHTLPARAALVQHILTVCKLQDVAGRLVERVTPAQLVRTRIAVNLASLPSVLVLEDPCMADDVQGTRLVMEVLRDIAAQGVTVLLSLKSPSAETVSACDNVVIQSGVYTLYAGALGGEHAVRVAEAAKAQGVPVPHPALATATRNPLALIVRQWARHHQRGVGKIGSAVVAVLSDNAKAQPGAVAATMVEGVNPLLAGQGIIKEERGPRQPFVKQFLFMQKRMFLEGFRNVPMNFGRQVIFVAISLFVGLLFLDMDASDMRGSNAKSSIVFFLCTTGSITTFTTVGAHVLSKVRPWVYRERASGWYLPEAFSLSQGLAEIPWVLLSSLIFNIAPYAMAHLDWAVFDFHIFIHMLLCVSLAFAAHFIAAAAPAAPAAGLGNLMFISFNALLAGTFVSILQMPEHFRWVNKAVPISWAGRAIVMNTMWCDGPAYSLPAYPAAVLKHGCVWFTTQLLPTDLPRPWDRYELFAERWQASYGDRWLYAGYLAAFICAYRVATVLAWRLFHWGKAKV